MRTDVKTARLEQVRELVETDPMGGDAGWTQQDSVASADSPQCVQLRNGALSGELCANGPEVDNACCTASQNGFRSFQHSLFPGHNIFHALGLNFEHILSGRAKDWDAGNFAPRKEGSSLRVYSESSAALVWPASNSCWGAGSKMTFSLDRDSHVDLEFRTAFQGVPDKDYLIYMWAAYMKRTQAATIRFWGIENYSPTALGRDRGDWGWVSLDGQMRLGSTHVEQGIVHFPGTPQVLIERGISNLNFYDNDWCAFALPFFFGVVDGDGDLSTTQDSMAYIMMFDQAEPLRFVMWDFSSGTGDPVWDWQYIIRKPQAANTYGYRARLAYKPYAGLDDVVAEYVHWTKSLGPPLHRLTVAIVPPESAVLFPANSEGMYGENVQVYFGVNPARGWRFDHWEGNVTYRERRFTRLKMNRDEAVRAVCRREK